MDKGQQLGHEGGCVQVPSLSDPKTIAGQDTAGLEILQDLAQVDEVHVAIAGGGLIIRHCTSDQELSPRIKIYMESDKSNVRADSVRDQELVVLQNVENHRVGLAAKATGCLNLSIDGIILVSDHDIFGSTLFLLEEAKVLVEPFWGREFCRAPRQSKREGRAALVLSGGKCDSSQLLELQSRLAAVESSSRLPL